MRLRIETIVRGAALITLAPGAASADEGVLIHGAQGVCSLSVPPLARAGCIFTHL
jgi:hypothetical protein